MRESVAISSAEWESTQQTTTSTASHIPHGRVRRVPLKGKGPNIVGEKENVAPKYFRASEPVPTHGVFRVHHANHRESHEVTLTTGQLFPRCAKCGLSV